MKSFIIILVIAALTFITYTNAMQSKMVKYVYLDEQYDCIQVNEQDQPWYSEAPDQLICFHEIQVFWNFTDYKPYFYVEDYEVHYF